MSRLYGPAIGTSIKPAFDGGITRKGLPTGALLVVLAMHFPAALLMQRLPMVSTIHAVATLALGLYLAFTRNFRGVGVVAGYIVGSEVLWRMTGAGVFWEFAKYAIILVLGVGWLRGKQCRSVLLPVVFFLLLIPSAVVTIMELGFSETAREYIGFNLSGPLSLAVSVMFFSQRSFRSVDIKQIAWGVVVPLVGVAGLAVNGILTTEEIVFTDESNFVTSGGFGPNQVSAVLGLAALFLFLIALSERRNFVQFFCALLAVFFIVFSVLTFSRGGIYNFGIAVLLSTVHFLRSSRSRGILLLIIIGGGLVGGYWIYPRLDEFTNGKLTSRYANFDTTNRLEIAQREIEAGLSYPLFGSGPGMAKFFVYEKTGVLAAAHTEYSRVLGEHGVLGLFALAILGLMALSTYRRTPHWMARTWVIALLAWPLMEMTHAAMRLAAIGFLFGLAFVGWKTQRSAPHVLPSENTARR